MQKIIFSFINHKFEHMVCSICLSAMAGCILLQVVLRFFFSAASAWAEEIAVYSMVAAVYFGACLGVKERAHIRILAVINLLPGKLKLASVVVADILWFAFLVFLLYQSLSYSRLLFDSTYITPGLGIEMRWPHSIVPFCLVLMCIRIFQVYYLWLAAKDRSGVPL